MELIGLQHRQGLVLSEDRNGSRGHTLRQLFVGPSCPFHCDLNLSLLVSGDGSNANFFKLLAGSQYLRHSFSLSNVKNSPLSSIWIQPLPFGLVVLSPSRNQPGAIFRFFAVQRNASRRVQWRFIHRCDGTFAGLDNGEDEAVYAFFPIIHRPDRVQILELSTSCLGVFLEVSNDTSSPLQHVLVSITAFHRFRCVDTKFIHFTLSSSSS